LRTAAQIFLDRQIAPIKSWCIKQPLALAVGESRNADPDHLQCSAASLGAQAINAGPNQRQRVSVAWRRIKVLVVKQFSAEGCNSHLRPAHADIYSYKEFTIGRK